MNHELYVIGKEACRFIESQQVLGLGTGSTVEAMIQVWQREHSDKQPEAVVVSSKRTHTFCNALGIETCFIDRVVSIDTYIDGVDQIDKDMVCIKGGGAAMTGEKLCAELAKTFVAIGVEGKYTDTLDACLPIEVIPWAMSACARFMHGMCTRVERRLGAVTDSGHPILDCWGLSYAKAYSLDQLVAGRTGVVGHGLFAEVRPDVFISCNNKTPTYRYAPKYSSST